MRTLQALVPALLVAAMALPSVTWGANGCYANESDRDCGNRLLALIQSVAKAPLRELDTQPRGFDRSTLARLGGVIVETAADLQPTTRQAIVDELTKPEREVVQKAIEAYEKHLDYWKNYRGRHWQKLEVYSYKPEIARDLIQRVMKIVDKVR